MWFPQSWQWKYERRRDALGGLLSPVLNDLHSQGARRRQRISSVWTELISGRICPQSVLHHPFIQPSHLSHLALTLML